MPKTWHYFANTARQTRFPLIAMLLHSEMQRQRERLNVVLRGTEDEAQSNPAATLF